MDFNNKHKLVKAFLKKSKKASRNLLVETVAATSILGAVSVSGNALTNVALQTVQASTKKTKTVKTAKLVRNCYVYNSKGKRISKKSLKKNKTVKVYGAKVIKGKTYYNLGHGRYVAIRNVKTAQTVKVTKTAYIYNSQGKRISKKALKKCKSLKVYGTKTIKGKKYYSLGNGSYVPVNKVKVPKPATTPTGDNNNGQTTNNTPTKPNTTAPAGNNGGSTVPSNSGQTPSQPSTPVTPPSNGGQTSSQPVTPPNDSTTNPNLPVQENQCAFSYDESTKTLHIKAGEKGNQLGTGDIFDQAIKAGTISEDNRNNVKHIKIDEPIIAPVNSNHLFDENFAQDITGLNNLDTSKVTSMVWMFANLHDVTSLDLSGFNTSKVTDMAGMFANDLSLEHVKLTSFNTSKVTSMADMFAADNALNALDLSNFNTGNVKYMEEMFAEDPKLQTITGLNKFDTSKVDNMKGMFNADSQLTKLDLSNFNTKHVTNMSYMFWGNTSLTSLDLSKFDIGSKTNTDHMIDYVKVTPTKPYSGTIATANSNYKSLGYSIDYDFLYDKATKTLHIVVVQGLDKPVFNGTFSGWITLTKDITGVSSDDIEHISIDSPIKIYHNNGDSSLGGFAKAKDITGLDKVDTSDATDMREMFEDDKALTSLDLSNWDTSNVTNMSDMFEGDKALTSLDLSKWNTSNVTDMREMFEDDEALTSLDLSKWNTSNVTDMREMFEDDEALTSLDLSNWDTSNVTNMNDMFEGDKALTSLDLSKWNTSNVTDMREMFEDDEALTSLDLSNWDTSNVTNMSDMFEGDKALTSLDLNNWNTSNVTDMSWMFQGCSGLTEIKTKNNNPKEDLGTASTSKNHMFDGTYLDPNKD